MHHMVVKEQMKSTCNVDGFLFSPLQPVREEVLELTGPLYFVLIVIFALILMNSLSMHDDMV